MATPAICSQTMIFKVRFCANSTQVLEMNEFALDPERRAGSAKWVSSIQPCRTGKRAMCSSRRLSAIPALKAGRISAVMLIFEMSKATVSNPVRKHALEAIIGLR